MMLVFTDNCICDLVRGDHKSPTETAGSDCCSSDSRPNSRGSSIEIRLSQGNKSRGPSGGDGDSDEGNDYESEVHISGSGSIGTSASPSQGNSENKSLVTGGSQSNNNLNGGGSKRKKKTRTVFSRSQVFQLESTFDVKRYLSSTERAGLAASLHLTETQVNSLAYTCFLNPKPTTYLLLTLPHLIIQSLVTSRSFFKLPS